MVLRFIRFSRVQPVVRGDCEGVVSNAIVHRPRRR
jgi:hypothetical protein